MKKYILIFICLFSVYLTDSYAQIATFRDSLTVSDTVNVHHILQGRDWDFIHLTITLSNANDTVKVYTGTNYPGYSYGSNDYVQVGLRDKLTSGDVQVITGSTATKGYLILYSPKQRNIIMDAVANTGEITYTLELY